MVNPTLDAAARAPNDALIEFYFDFISPFGYFASLRIDALAARYGSTAEWHAMLLTVIVDGEPFWGVETLGSVEQWLQTGGW